MSILIPNTNYLITDSQGNIVDISTIFNAGSSPTITNLNFYNTTLPSPVYVDINTVINTIQPGDTPVADTGYKVIINNVPTDLSQLFQPKITVPSYYTISPSYYPTQEVQNGGYYYIAFPYYTTSSIATITFNQSINNINVVVVGGGGSGREWSFLSGIIRSGGGGAGGGVAHATFNATAGNSYNISVGQGGQVSGGGGVTNGQQTTFTSVSNPANIITCTGGQAGINDGSGSGYALGGFGTVTGGIFSTITAGTGGNGGQSLTSSSKGSINNGENSAITSLIIPAGTFPYGLGGGGGAGDFGSTTKGGTAGNGTGGICGAAPTGQGTTPTGYGCGGGGSASEIDTNYNTIGNNGLVLIYFNPSYSPYTATGLYTQEISGGYYTIIFTGNGSIIFNNNLTANILVCGGGGGGGGGSGTANVSGGGGGAGGIGVLTINTLIVGTSYNITVGNGSNGGNGNNSAQNASSSSFSTLITSTGGNGGKANSNGGGGGASGTSSGTNVINYSSGNGGKGYNVTAGLSGSNTIGTSGTSITFGNKTVTIGGGGGGGGTAGTNAGKGGNAGLDGNGGIYSGNSTVSGQNASSTSYGSGGGGGQADSARGSGNGVLGGNGAPGVVIINFEYP